VTFVAIDEKTHRPKPVRPLILESPEEKTAVRGGRGAAKTRLALRYGT